MASMMVIAAVPIHSVVHAIFQLSGFVRTST